MAKVNVAPTKLGVPNIAGEVAFSTATTPADGFLVDFTGKDEDIVLLFSNAASSTATVTVKAGNGLQGVADLVLSVPQNKQHAVVINSGEHKIVSGADKGKVHVVVSAATVTMAAIELP